MTAGGPFSNTVQTFPAAETGERSTKRLAGSTTVEKISRKAPSAPRFLITSCTFPRGSGKRIDSWNVRQVPAAASPVVSHSP